MPNVVLCSHIQLFNNYKQQNNFEGHDKRLVKLRKQQF